MNEYEWDAAAYHQVSRPQVAWGEAVLAELAVRGDEQALDVGCGSGHLTRRLAERLPHGHVVAVDRSPAMIAEARRTLPADEPGRAGVTFVLADAAALPFRSRFDLIFSTATFHWVPDHDALVGSLFLALEPGGRLWSQSGGGPNLARFHARASALMKAPAFAPHFDDWRAPWNFQDAEATAARLERAGFVNIETEVFEAPTIFPDDAAYRAFVRTVIAGPHLAYLPTDALRDAFLDELTRQAAQDAPRFMLDYWRLGMRARRPGSVSKGQAEGRLKPEA